VELRPAEPVVTGDVQAFRNVELDREHERFVDLHGSAP
jgi:hypothetical protein